MPDDTESPEVEVLPAPPLRLVQDQLSHIKDPVIATQARVLGSYGLGVGAVMTALRVRDGVFRKYYKEDYLEGQAAMQKQIAVLAMEAAKEGSVPMIMYLCKSKLGWNETNVVEHTGEVRSVVSNRPMTKEEFTQKYLTKSKEGGVAMTNERSEGEDNGS